MMVIRVVILWIFLGCYWETTAQSHTNFFIKNIDSCVKESPVLYNVSIITQHGSQYLYMKLISPMSLDHNIGFILGIETLLNTVYITLFTIRENDFCKAANKYGGEFWYDIQRAAQMLPGNCPIPPGRYLVNHMLLDTSKVTLQTFPFGTLRLTLRAIDKRNNQDVMCLKMVIENKTL